MKTKLQALIAEQKALTARFEELLHSTTEESSTLDPQKVYIKGHPTRGAEVIKMLEDLGGVNKAEFIGDNMSVGYYIVNGYIFNANMCDLFDYTELHLPELSSSEKPNNSNNTIIAGIPLPLQEVADTNVGNIQDIKVGDWIWVDNIPTSNTIDCDIRKIVHHNPHKIVEINKDGDICFNVAGESMFINSFEGDKFHKVDPPKEEVELIEGEVYVMGDYIGIFKQLTSNNHTKWYCVLESKQGLKSFEITYGQCLNAKIATPEQRKQLFDALEKAGKYFDKENMRLIDVEEWGGKVGEAFIYMTLDGLWEAAIFDDKSNYNNAPFYFIPYNDKTKYIIGTTDIPDKHYKFVSE